MEKLSIKQVNKFAKQHNLDEEKLIKYHYVQEYHLSQ